MTSQESYELRNQVSEVLFRVIGPYAPPEAIMSYWNGTQRRWVRNLEGISDKSMLLLVSYNERMREDRGSSETFNRQGYEYVCKRIKSPEVTPQEVSDLKKVKRAYDIMDEFRQLIIAAQKGNVVKVNQILSKGAMA